MSKIYDNILRDIFYNEDSVYTKLRFAGHYKSKRYGESKYKMIAPGYYNIPASEVNQVEQVLYYIPLLCIRFYGNPAINFPKALVDIEIPNCSLSLIPDDPKLFYEENQYDTNQQLAIDLMLLEEFSNIIRLKDTHNFQPNWVFGVLTTHMIRYINMLQIRGFASRAFFYKGIPCLYCVMFDYNDLVSLKKYICVGRVTENEHYDPNSIYPKEIYTYPEEDVYMIWSRKDVSKQGEDIEELLEQIHEEYDSYRLDEPWEHDTLIL